MKKILLVCILSFFPCYCAFSFFHQDVLPLFDDLEVGQTPEDFPKIAGQYGNKTTNLCILNGRVKKINETELADSSNSVAVPAFFAISHDEVKNFLKRHFDAHEEVSFDDLWRQFGERLGDKESLDTDTKEVLSQT